jgi:carbon monoxide dehydrogenase subunit G
MQQSGEYRIGAPVGAVWTALNDPDVLARCIDGCQSMTRTGPDAFQAVVKAKVGPVSATFTADIALADQDPPTSYTIQANVKAGPAGFGKGAAKVRLDAEGGETLLRYEVEGSVGGKLAQIGQRLIEGTARKMADGFFARFAAAVAPAPDMVPSQ